MSQRIRPVAGMLLAIVVYSLLRAIGHLLRWVLAW